MRKLIFVVVALTGALALLAGSSLAGASPKFAYTEQITAARSLAVDFEEGSLKRFAGVDYQLNGTAIALWECDGSQEHILLNDAVTLMPNDKGRTTGTLTLVMPSSGHLCAPTSVEYVSTTLTNVTTGHVYRLDPISE